MKNFPSKLLEMWISIPRSLRVGFLTIVVIIFLVYVLIKGISEIINLFNGTSFLTWPTILLALVLAFIILILFSKK